MPRFWDDTPTGTRRTSVPPVESSDRSPPPPSDENDDENGTNVQGSDDESKEDEGKADETIATPTENDADNKLKAKDIINLLFAGKQPVKSLKGAVAKANQKDKVQFT